MEEVRDSNSLSSTSKLVEAHAARWNFFVPLATVFRRSAFALAGFVAGEGSFVTTEAHPPRNDGSRRTRFIFQLTVAQHDRHLLEAMQSILGGIGSIRDVPNRRDGWLPLSSYRVTSRLQTRQVLIPFFDQFLLRSAKRDQFDAWRAHFERYESAHPTQGLCRSHYYRATGY